MQFLGNPPEVLPLLKTGNIYLVYCNDSIIIGKLEISNKILEICFIGCTTGKTRRLLIAFEDNDSWKLYNYDIVFSITDEEFNKHVLMEII